MRKELFLLPFFFLLAGSVWAMPGAGCTPGVGDDCTNPQTTTGNSGCGTNTTAAAVCPIRFSAPNPCDAAQATGTMFFVEVTAGFTCNDLDFDLSNWTGGGSMNAFIFTADCASGTYSTVASDCITGSGTLTASGLAAGTYYLAFGGTNGVTGSADWCFQVSNAGAPPANDDCVNAENLAADVIHNRDVFCATSGCDYSGCASVNEDCNRTVNFPVCNSTNVASCWGSVENSVWFSFTAPTTDNYDVQLFNQNCNTEFGVQFAVFSSVDCNNAANTVPNELACTNNQDTSAIFETIAMTAGQTYYIVVDGFAGAQCDFDLLISTLNILPVTWSGMSLEERNGSVVINWSTENETNNQEFIIEAATSDVDAFADDQMGRLNWVEVGRVPGFMNSHNKKDYSFVDYNPAQGFNFYRLRQVDVNGAMSANSRILSTFIDNGQLKDGDQFQVSPNPFTSTVELSYTLADPRGTIYFQVFDIQGRVVYSQELLAGERGRNGEKIDLSHLDEGAYFYQVKSATSKQGGKLLKR